MSNRPANPAPVLPFLRDTGEMSRRIASHDWAGTAVGPMEGWPQSLRTTLSIMLASRFPMSLAWGPELTVFHNDAYTPMLGAKAPFALGARMRDLWADVWQDIAPLVDSAFAGEATWRDDMHLVMHRNGYPEDTWWTFSYTPVRDESGAVAGMLNITSDSTSKVLNERRLVGDREQLARMFEQAPTFMALLQGPEHRVEFVNPGYTRLIGGRDVVGQRIADTLPDAVAQGYLALLDKVYASGEAYSANGATYAVQPEIGGPVMERRVDFVYQPLLDSAGQVVGIFVEGVDVTDRMQADAVLRRQEAQLHAQAQLRTVFETSFQWQCLCDLDGRLLEANQTALDAIGREVGDVAGQPFWETPWFSGTPGMVDAVRSAFVRTFEGGNVRREISLELPAGTRSFDFSVRPLRDPAGSIVSIVAEAVDTTERRQAEAALRQSQKLEAMGQLTGGVAHDFNNLLTPIVMGLELIDDQGVPVERRQRMLGAARQSADRASTLVQRLLAFARRQPLQFVDVNVERLVSNMAELIASTCTPRIRLEMHIEPGLAHATADPNQLEMAILNLSVNARDAMPGGGTLTISAHNRRITAPGRPGLAIGDYVLVCVIDTGTGMDEATRIRAIEPFFSTKGVGKGTGLGLSMVHGLVMQLGGKLEIESHPGVGTTMALWLPVGNPDNETNNEDDVVNELQDISRGVALVVDDEAFVRMCTADVLVDMGYAVVESASAEEALQAIDDGLVPELLVTDHLMPGMNGSDLAREVQARFPTTPIVVVSGYTSVEGLDPGLVLLNKPFKQRDLVASVQAAAGMK